MDQVKLEQVDVNTLQDLPVMTKNISPKLVQMTAKIAKSRPSDIRPMLVGRVNGLLYPVNEFETVSGLRKASVKTMDAFIVDYPGMKDLLVDHVRKNFEPHAIDPLRIRDVIEYMTKNYNMDVSEVCKVLWLDRRPELFDAVQYEITKDTKKILLEMIEEISKKLYIVVTPLYYVECLSEIDAGAQSAAALDLRSITESKMTSPTRAAWPVRETVTTMLSKYPKKIENLTVEERIGRMSSIEDMKKRNVKRTTKKPSPKTVKKAAEFIKKDPNVIYVPRPGNDPDLLIHKKTGRVAEAKEMHGVCAMVGDKGEATHMISNDLIKFLNIDDDKKITTYKYSSPDKLKKAADRCKMSDQRFVVHSNGPIPRA